MSRTAFNAPAHRTIQRQTLGSVLPANAPNAAPSLDYGGNGLQDPRLPYNTVNSSAGAQIIGWLGAKICVCNQVPSTVSTTNMAAAQNVTSGTAMTLVSSTGSGITVVPSGGFLALPSLNTIPAGALAIDGEAGYIRLGLTDFSCYYDPTAGISRGVSITGAAGATGGNFLIAGYDWYGYPMSQQVTHAGGATTINTLKTFKWVTSVTPQFTDAHNYSVGTADIFGFNLASDYFSEVSIFWADVLQAVATYLPAVTTKPATTTTGDVRGTFTPGSASNNSRRLQIFVTPSAGRLTASPMSQGLFGIAQV